MPKPRPTPHPLSEIYPMLGGDAWEEFKEDVRVRGLDDKITLYKGMILDGRNREKACFEVGRKCLTEDFEGTEEEAAAYCHAKNLHRRHLTVAQKKKVVETILKKSPELSSRTVAKAVGIHHSTVESERKKLESTGEISQLETTTGADGKKRKKKKKTTPPEPSSNGHQTGIEGSVINPPEAPPEAKPESTQVAEETEQERYVADVEALCRDLDKIAGRIDVLKVLNLAYSIEWKAAADQIRATRSAIWNGRPTVACLYCAKGAEPCKPLIVGTQKGTGCRGTGFLSEGAAKRAIAAVGGKG